MNQAIHFKACSFHECRGRGPHGHLLFTTGDGEEIFDDEALFSWTEVLERLATLLISVADDCFLKTEEFVKILEEATEAGLPGAAEFIHLN